MPLSKGNKVTSDPSVDTPEQKDKKLQPSPGEAWDSQSNPATLSEQSDDKLRSLSCNADEEGQDSDNGDSNSPILPTSDPHLKPADKKVRPCSASALNNTESAESNHKDRRISSAGTKRIERTKSKTHNFVRQSSDLFLDFRQSNIKSTDQSEDKSNNGDNIDELSNTRPTPVVKLGAPADEYEPVDDPLLDFYVKAVNRSECVKVSCSLTTEQTINIDLCQRGNKTALQLAIQDDNIDMVKHLVQHHDASIQWRDRDDGSNILHYTARLSNKHASFVKFLLERMEKSWLQKVSHDGSHPIVVAIEHGGSEVVLQKLQRIEAGCQIDSLDKDPIDLALKRQNGIPIVKYLVEKELVDLRKGKDGNTSAHRTAFSWNAEALEIILKADPSLACERAQDGATPLMKVAMNSSGMKINRGVKCAHLLVSTCKANINAAAKALDGWTVLHFAVDRENYKLVDFLIKQKDIAVDTYDDAGKTPLMYSLYQRKFNIAKLLLEKGKADPNLHQKGPNGKEMGNCVEIVAELGCPDMAKLVLGHPGIEVAEKNAKGNTPLHTVIHKCAFTSSIMITEHFRQTAVLLASHANEVINIADNLGRTPLHLAIVTDGTYPVIRRMLSCCTNVHMIIDQKDEKGYTPLHLAVQRTHSSSHLALVRLLVLQYGASLSFAHDGKTPLHIALELQEEEIVALFVHHRNVWEFVDQDVLHDIVINMPHLLENGLDRNIKAAGEKRKAKMSASDEALQDPPDKIILDGSHIVDKIYVPQEGELTRHDHGVRPKMNPTKKEKKFHHHLRLIADAGNAEICTHPVVKAVWRNKWKMASTIYFIYLIYYLSFVGAVSAYMLSAHPPYNVSDSGRYEFHDLDHTCNDSSMRLLNGIAVPLFIIFFAVVGLIMEILQVIYAGIREVLTLLNLSDWLTFVAAIIMVIDMTGCQIHTKLQWTCGVLCVFLAWINLLFYLRKLPELGIYVVMIGMVLTTFFKFFLVFFLFILAFAICFSLLLGNQYAFQHPGYSIIKTWVMMVGELEFTGMFHTFRDDSSPESQVHFETATYCLFAAFLIIMSLIIMNLLTGLAVSDVTLLQEDSLRYMRIMKVNASLDVEQAMPSWLHAKLYKATLELDLKEADRGFNMKRLVFTFLDNLYFGPLSLESIRNDAEAVIKRNKGNRAKEFAEKADESQAEEIGELKNKVDELDRKIAAAVSEIRDVTMHLNNFFAVQSKQ